MLSLFFPSLPFVLEGNLWLLGVSSVAKDELFLLLRSWSCCDVIQSYCLVQTPRNHEQEVPSNSRSLLKPFTPLLSDQIRELP